ncbi:NUDIX hydrolase [Shewanella schlegeliana]|uniref:Phosphatase NudJ n=1 Tax=Shewanella schlegeliana TaxID=190308 RepID=A0ABS1STI0_9GAMM|nr:NUDIX hydrolase [Shewanella schlegeliana]MBL4911849.1 NUDIX hydrolase [Shewanella schlegeliana]MCL1110198.1 NUDIX hydrolase [Shewanella schlegeliana]GIU27176.1 NUDIX hydrolase [Shewanella schlegeliana]
MAERYRPYTTVACVIEAQEKFLIVEELIAGELKYNQPAGHIEADESIVDACIREVKEETGLALQPQGLVGIYQYRASEVLSFVRYTFFVKLDKVLTSKPEDPTINALKWLSLDEINQLSSCHRSPLVLKSIDDYLDGKHYPLEIIDDEYV